MGFNNTADHCNLDPRRSLLLSSRHSIRYCDDRLNLERNTNSRPKSTLARVNDEVASVASAKNNEPMVSIEIPIEILTPLFDMMRDVSKSSILSQDSFRSCGKLDKVNRMNEEEYDTNINV